MTLKHDLQRPLRIAVACLVHVLWIRMLGETAASGVMQMIGDYVKRRRNCRNSGNS